MSTYVLSFGVWVSVITVHSRYTSLIGVHLSLTVSRMRAAPMVVLTLMGSSMPGTSLHSFAGPDTRILGSILPSLFGRGILIFL